MKGLRALTAIAFSGLVLISCSSGGAAGRPRISYGTDARQIARQLGICRHPTKVTKTMARCRFPDGAIIAVNNIAGPADQQLEIPAAKQTGFCELVGHGFGVTGLAYSLMKRHVDINGIVAKYGGRVVGSSC